MPLAKLKDKGQITLPSNIRKKIDADKGDIFNFEVIDNTVVMTLQKIIPANEEKEPDTDISQYIGAGSGIFKSVKEVDDFIRKERDAWD